jgi:hypothetical protein
MFQAKACARGGQQQGRRQETLRGACQALISELNQALMSTPEVLLLEEEAAEEASSSGSEGPGSEQQQQHEGHEGTASRLALSGRAGGRLAAAPAAARGGQHSGPQPQLRAVLQDSQLGEAAGWQRPAELLPSPKRVAQQQPHHPNKRAAPGPAAWAAGSGQQPAHFEAHRQPAGPRRTAAAAAEPGCREELLELDTQLPPATPGTSSSDWAAADTGVGEGAMLLDEGQDQERQQEGQQQPQAAEGAATSSMQEDEDEDEDEVIIMDGPPPDQRAQQEEHAALRRQDQLQREGLCITGIKPGTALLLNTRLLGTKSEPNILDGGGEDR